MEPPLPPLSGAAAVLLLLPLLLVPVALLARRRRGRRAPPLSLLVVAGSGGHTTEILRLLSCLSESYSPRHYIFADSDKMSEAKIRSFEQKRAERFSNSQFTLDRIPRSREVRQSWISSVVTTLYSILYSFPLTYKLKPDLELLLSPTAALGTSTNAQGLQGQRSHVTSATSVLYFVKAWQTTIRSHISKTLKL
ncbi:UDP-N-acetylglucosamine transferase subunit ALG14 isoform X2 [Anas acuta]|uniref:UDP-N-acetylglucosamine transferase subunit ALG14 isoform X2 n=1 Tax=Anas acuta TaxID=28680 RepID=UPI0035C890E2